MSTPARRVTRSTTGTERESSARLQFWEQGSDVLHQGEGAQFEPGRLSFESDYGVSPGTPLAVRMVGGLDLFPGLGAELTVERLDALPGGRFRIAGRWRVRS